MTISLLTTLLKRHLSKENLRKKKESNYQIHEDVMIKEKNIYMCDVVGSFAVAAFD